MKYKKGFQLIACFLCGAFLAMSLSCAKDDEPSPAEETVEFLDPNLEALIRVEIGKATGDIVASDLATLTSLDGAGMSIWNVTGLEYCSGLRELDLGHNQITDVSPLGDLVDLMRLSLRDNEISDVSPLAALVNLERLSLGGNGMTDVGPLAALVKLKKLLLWGNHVRDVSPLAALA